MHTSSVSTPHQRLASLDALRGFDLLMLVAVGPLVLQFVQAVGGDSLQGLATLFTHKDWEGFSPWDLIMPLFVFMSGASIPFALSRMKQEKDYRSLTYRLSKRIALLWIFGMICQGNLLGLDPDRIYFYSNTLQSIALGYLVAALFFMFTGWRTQLIAAIVMLLVYWAGMEFVTVGPYGGGNYTPELNFAEWLDVTVLGRFRDGAQPNADGQWTFAPWYHYTWIWSSINFGVTALTGMFAGLIAKSTQSSSRKLGIYFGGALAMIALGWLWGLQMPVIKTIWTSSMVLVSSGYCFLLMAIFYYIYDVRHASFGLHFLKIYGMNSITAYMLTSCVNFRCIAHSLFYGTEQYLNGFYPFLLDFSQVVFIFLLLRYMLHHGIFLKV